MLLPLGIGRAKLADPLESDKLNGEVVYYDYPGAPATYDIFDLLGPGVPAPYGGPATNFLAKEATSGWVTTTIDLLRFINGLDGLPGGPLLTPSTIQLMESESSVFRSAADYYGVGIQIHRVGNGFDWWKEGGYPGTIAYVYCHANGLAWAALFNTTGFDPLLAVENALSEITSIPADDQLDSFTSTLVQPALAMTNPVVSGATFQPGIVAGSCGSASSARILPLPRGLGARMSFSGTISASFRSASTR